MNKKLVLLGAAMLMTAATASAQKRVTGRVVDTAGEPVVGASVRVEGAKGSAVTDANGHFTLVGVPASAKNLKVTYIGKETKTVSIAGNVNVVLADNETVLGEAYVTAYGRATKASFTGAAAKVKGEKIEEKSTTEVTQALQGEVAGVQVITSDGNPGSSADIIIRGTGSLFSSSAPLIIVDGVPYGGAFSSIDPKDIASIDIQKDATASALYGSRGANGVVIITTKRGQKGTVKIGADMKYSVSGRWLPTYDVISSPERFTELSWESLKGGYQLQGATDDEAAFYASETLFGDAIPAMYNMWNAEGNQLIDPATGRFYSGITRRYTPESWEDAIYRTGQKWDGNINISGGNDRTQFYTALGYTKDKGYLIGADFQRFNARLNVDSRITDWLKGSVNMAYSNLESNAPVQDDGAANNALEFVNLAPALYPVYQHDEDGNVIMNDVLGGPAYDYGDAVGAGRPFRMNMNPAGNSTLDLNKTIADQLTANGTLEATFLRDFRFAVNLGYTYYNVGNTTITNPYYGDGASAGGRLDKSFQLSRNITGNQILSWARTFGLHHVNAMVGHESYWYNSEVTYGSKYTVVDPFGEDFDNAVNIQSLGGYSRGYSLDSYFGQVGYDYDNKYFFTASLRTDGSSRFVKGHRWGTFGALSGAWNITKEDFMKGQDIVRNLKLKASWGIVGNQSLSLGSQSYYPYADMYNIANMNGKPSIMFAAKGNSDLTWEKSSNFNIGLEFDLGGVLEGEVDYFNKLTYDMLFSKTVSPTLGYASFPVNDGKLRNSGIEFSLVAHLIKNRDMNLDFRLNGTHLNTTMVEMPMDDGTGQRKDYYKNGYFAWTKGRSIYDYYMPTWMGVDSETGLATYKTKTAIFADGTKEVIKDMELFKSQNKGADYTIEEGVTEDWTQAVNEYVGENALPALTGGFGFDFRYKQVSFGATFTYALGGKAMDYTYQNLMADGVVGNTNWHKDIENRWQKPGDITDVPRLTNESDEGYYSVARSTRFLTSRSYLALSNVRLAYSLPDHIANRFGGMSGVQVYVSGENLFMITARKGFMPGTNYVGTSSYTQYMPSSNVTMGLKLNF